MDQPSRLHSAYVGLGSNLDEPERQLATALDALDRIPSTRLLARSSLYGSVPVGKADQPDFVNAVAVLATDLTPWDLLRSLQQIELDQGRVRTELNGPRTLDLDLLLYDDQVIRQPDLVVPHPRMHERAFVLAPLAEVSPHAVIPGRGLAADLLSSVADQRVTKRAQDDR